MTYSLEFLCWVNRCLFPGDFERELIEEIGVRENVARGLAVVLDENDRNILNVYQGYGLKQNEYKDALDKYLEYMHEKWIEINERIG
jgi:hypothetical protein